MNNIENKETISESRKKSFETQMNVYDTIPFVLNTRISKNWKLSDNMRE